MARMNIYEALVRGFKGLMGVQIAGTRKRDNYLIFHLKDEKKNVTGVIKAEEGPFLCLLLCSFSNKQTDRIKSGERIIKKEKKDDGKDNQLSFTES